MAEYGLDLDPWQKMIISAWLARDEDDRFVHTTCGLAVPRQNGKNVDLEAREFYGAVVNGEKILHTAHQVKTSKKAFNRLAAMFTNRDHPEICEMVVNIRRTNGEESILLNNGGSIEYSARSRGAARGWTVDTVIYDEAQELTDEQVEAIMATLAAAPSGNRQLIYTGTPPGPTSPGTVFSRIRKQASERPGKRMCWHEWSVEEIGDVLDKKRWYATNPALGIRLDEAFTEEECGTMSEDGFARERLGWWSSQQAICVINRDKWAKCVTENPPTTGKKAFGVKFSVDGSSVCLAAARKPESGSPHIELIQVANMSDGIRWLSDFLIERADETAIVVIDGKSGTDALLTEIRDSFPKQAIAIPGTRGVIAASSMLISAIDGGEITHWNQGQTLLDESATSCVKRPIGNDGGYGFGGDNPLPIEAASLALYGVMTTKRDPSRGCEVL